MPQRSDRAALLFRHVGMQLRKRLDRDLVNQPARRKARRLDRQRIAHRLHNRLRHPWRGIAALPALRSQPGVMDIGPVENGRIRIDQQFFGIKPVALLRRIMAIGAEAVSGSGPNCGNGKRKNAVALAGEFEAFGFAVAGFVEKGEPDTACPVRPDRKARAGW